MSRKMVGVLLLLCASVAVGILIGEQFYRLFLDNVPPMALNAVGQGAAHALFLFYGLGLGVVMCGWSLLAVMLSGLFRNGEPKPRPRELR